MRKLTLVALAILLLLSPSLSRPQAAEAADGPLALAFYYAWFDENSWNPTQLSDLPAQRYASRDRATIERHVSQAQAAGIDAFVQSYWGPGNQTEDNFKTLLDVAQARGFRAAIDFEVTAPPYNGSRAAVVSGLRHAITTHTSHPAYLRWDGKPVIFFWRQQQYSVNDWAAIRNEVDPSRSTIWIAEGTDTSFLAQFDGHHLYSVAWAPDPAPQLVKVGNWVRGVEGRWGNKIWVATVMPGYDDTRLGRPNGFRRDRANGAYFRETFRGARESQADWVIVNSFNEWPEGTYIEPGERYGDAYLTLTAELVAGWKSGQAPAPVAVPPAAPVPPGNGAADWAIPGGRFYTQAASQQGGFSVQDDAQARFWTEFQRLGGLQTVGYPISQRFVYDGFVTQAFQKLVLQWRPEVGQAWPVNIFDELSKAGHDARLLETRQTPLPLGADFDAPGAAWPQVVAGRQALLNTHPALRQRYFSVGDPLTVFGLPTSRVEDMGNHYAIRTQRAVFQQWKEAVPWAAAGQVTIANGGDIAKELGWLPAAALVPQPLR
jgi:Ni/Co efflux regulator RcnB